MKTAKFIKTLDGFTGDARLYEVSPPIEFDGSDEPTSFVVVSATVAMFSGAETYIFPADKDGKVLDWGELDGSFHGELDHSKALEEAGYEEVA